MEATILVYDGLNEPTALKSDVTSLVPGVDQVLSWKSGTGNPVGTILDLKSPRRFETPAYCF